MIKKRAKSKAKSKKTGQVVTKRSPKKGKKEMNPAELRKDIAEMVGAEAGKLAGAVIEEGKKGQLATVKYLFEVAHIYPELPLDSQMSKDEDSLAKTLLDRLDIPDHPVVHDLYENGEDIVVIPPREKSESGEPAAEIEKSNQELAEAE